MEAAWSDSFPGFRASDCLNLHDLAQIMGGNLHLSGMGEHAEMGSSGSSQGRETSELSEVSPS